MLVLLDGGQWLELQFPKVVDFQTFDVTTLPLALFSTLSAGYTFKYRPVSGSLNAWVAAGSSAVNGNFDMRMELQNDGDAGGPKFLVVNGFFSLSN